MRYSIVSCLISLVCFLQVAIVIHVPNIIYSHGFSDRLMSKKSLSDAFPRFFLQKAAIIVSIERIGPITRRAGAFRCVCRTRLTSNEGNHITLTVRLRLRIESQLIFSVSGNIAPCLPKNEVFSTFINQRIYVSHHSTLGSLSSMSSILYYVWRAPKIEKLHNWWYETVHYDKTLVKQNDCDVIDRLSQIQ